VIKIRENKYTGTGEEYNQELQGKKLDRIEWDERLGGWIFSFGDIQLKIWSEIENTKSVVVSNIEYGDR
jgi:hypothetical protein